MEIVSDILSPTQVNVGSRESLVFAELYKLNVYSSGSLLTIDL